MSKAAAASSSSSSSAAAAPAAAASSGSSSLDALEGFRLLCKTSSGAQCVMVLQLVLKHPQIFVFGELLEIESVKQLATSDAHRPWFDLLKVFAYGTYGEYVSTKGLPPLGEAETKKLKQLTLVNMASKQRILPYSTLQSALQVNDLRVLEDLIIDCIYLGLIEGHLNQKDGSVEITSAIGRDIGPQDVAQMIKQLGGWLSSTDVVLSSLRDEVARVKVEEESKRLEDKQLEERKTKVLEELKNNKVAMATVVGGGGGGAGDDMGAARRKKGAAGSGAKAGGGMGAFRR